jgi:phage-related protein
MMDDLKHDLIYYCCSMLYIVLDTVRLDTGLMLSMPISRPMPSIGRGVHELRLKDQSGIYRLIYVFVGQGNLWLIHDFKKTMQQTPHKNIELAKKRLKEVL